MRISTDILQTIDENGVDLSSSWLWVDNDTYDTSYRQVLEQPISLEAITLDFCRWKVPTVTLTIRTTDSSASDVLFSGEAYLIDDDQNTPVTPLQTIYTSTGIIGNIPTVVDNGNGTVTVGPCSVALRDDPVLYGNILLYSVTSATFTIPSDSKTYYICAKFNQGTVSYYLEPLKGNINATTITPVYACWNILGVISSQYFGSNGDLLANKIDYAQTDTIPYRLSIGGGLIISENNLVWSVTSALVYAGTTPLSLSAITASTTNLIRAVHNNGVWTYSAGSATYGTTYYDDGVNLIPIGANKYAVRWIFRSISNPAQIYYCAGVSQYANFASADTEIIRSDLPETIRKHCILIGKAIIQKGATAGVTTSTFSQDFSNGAMSSTHNALGGIYGDSPFYHLSQPAYTEINNITALSGTGLLKLTAGTPSIDSTSYWYAGNHPTALTNYGISSSDTLFDAKYLGINGTASNASKLGYRNDYNYVWGDGLNYGVRTYQLSKYTSGPQNGSINTLTASTFADGYFTDTTQMPQIGWWTLMRVKHSDPSGTGGSATWGTDWAAAMTPGYGQSEQYCVRSNTNSSYGPWRTLIHSDNYPSFNNFTSGLSTTTLTASGLITANGGITGNLTGTASNASALGGVAASSYLLASTASSTYLPLSGGTMSGHLLGGTPYNIGSWSNWWGSIYATTIYESNVALSSKYLGIDASIPHTRISDWTNAVSSFLTSNNALTSFTPSFTVGVTGPTTRYVKLAQLPTPAIVASSQANINLTVYAANNYGTNVPTVTMLSFGTRGSISLLCRTINSSINNVSYGYVTNGNYVELWAILGPYSGQFTVEVNSCFQGSYGLLNDTPTNPGITTVTSTSMYDDRYLTGNQPITLSGAVTGSGTTSIATSFANTHLAGINQELTTTSSPTFGNANIGTMIGYPTIAWFGYSGLNVGTNCSGFYQTYTSDIGIAALSGHGVYLQVAQTQILDILGDGIIAHKPISGNLTGTASNASALGGVAADCFVQGSNSSRTTLLTGAVTSQSQLLKSGFYSSYQWTDAPVKSTWTHLIHSQYANDGGAGNNWSFDIAANFGSAATPGSPENYYVRAIANGISTGWRTLIHSDNYPSFNNFTSGLSTTTLTASGLITANGGITGNLSGTASNASALGGVAASSYLLASTASSTYQPLENQRLSTGNSPYFTSLGVASTNNTTNQYLIGLNADGSISQRSISGEAFIVATPSVAAWKTLTYTMSNGSNVNITLGGTLSTGDLSVTGSVVGNLGIASGTFKPTIIDVTTATTINSTCQGKMLVVGSAATTDTVITFPAIGPFAGFWFFLSFRAKYSGNKYGPASGYWWLNGTSQAQQTNTPFSGIVSWTGNEWICG